MIGPVEGGRRRQVSGEAKLRSRSRLTHTLVHGVERREVLSRKRPCPALPPPGVAGPANGRKSVGLELHVGAHVVRRVLVVPAARVQEHHVYASVQEHHVYASGPIACVCFGTSRECLGACRVTLYYKASRVVLKSEWCTSCYTNNQQGWRNQPQAAFVEPPHVLVHLAVESREDLAVRGPESQLR